MFRNVWVHSGPFRYCTKLGAKWDELVQLMQIFMPRSGIRIFRFERTRSTQTNPKLLFWCVSKCLGASGTVSLLHEIRSKCAELVQLMQKFMPLSRDDTFRYELT